MARRDNTRGAILLALKESNRRLVVGRCAGGKAALPSSVGVSELEELVCQVEAHATACGFAEDQDFCNMCEGLRKLDKCGGGGPMVVVSLHSLVREADNAKGLGERVRTLQKIDQWFKCTEQRIKRKAREERKRAKEAKKEADRRKALLAEGQRQREEKAQSEQAQAEHIRCNAVKKQQVRERRVASQKTKVQLHREQKKREEELKQAEQAQLQAELKKQRRMARKLVQDRQAAEAYRQQAELEAHEAQTKLREAKNVHQKAKTVEEEIERRVQAEVKRQLRLAIKEQMGQLEAEMFEASLKAKSYERQVEVQTTKNEPIVIEEAWSEDEIVEEEEWGGGDWGDSDDKGLGVNPCEEIRESLCVVQVCESESASDNESADPKSPEMDLEELERLEREEMQRANLAEVQEDLDEEKAEMLGLPAVHRNPPTLKLETSTVNVNVSSTDDEPMSNRYWEAQPNFNSETSVGDRVKFAVERARRMAELAYERRTGRGQD